MKKNLIYYLEYPLIFIAFFYLGFHRLSEAFIKPDIMVSEPFGDGIGTIGMIYEMVSHINQYGIKAFFGDYFETSNIGLGLLGPIHFNPYWKLHFWLLSHFFGPENIYDVTALLGFVLTGTLAYCLGRQLKLLPIFSILFAIFVTYLTNYEFRISGHLSLAFSYFHILLFIMAVRAGTKPTKINLVLLALCFCLAFLGNEYLGYFAGICATLITVNYYLINHNNIVLKERLQHSGRCLKIFLPSFLLMMIFFYPLTTLGPLLRRLGFIEVLPSVAKPADDFSMYALHTPMSLFSPGLSWLREKLSTDIFPTGRESEFTFRLGTILGFCLLLSAIIAFTLTWKKKDKILTEIRSWFIPLIIIFFFSLSPDLRISLVYITKAIFPMFRVGMRGLLFFDIIAMLIVCMVLNYCFEAYVLKNKNLVIRSLIAIGIGTLSILSFLDLRPEQKYLLSQINFYGRPPDTAIYNTLADKPKELLMELPYHKYPEDPPETEYQYLYNRIFHHKPIANFIYSDYAKNTLQFRQIFNNPSQRSVELLKKIGVKYLVINPSTEYPLQNYQTLQGLSLIGKSETRLIFEIQGNETWDRKKFFNEFIARGTFSFSQLPTRTQYETLPVENNLLLGGFSRVFSFANPAGGIYLNFGPYLILDRGTYRVTFTLKGENLLEDNNNRFLSLQIEAGKQNNQMDLLPRDFNGEFQNFDLTIRIKKRAIAEFRTLLYGSGRIIGQKISYERISDIIP